MPSLLHLTPTHFAVYDFIVKYKTSHDGVSPNYREISKACRISSTSRVRPILTSLALFGMITFDYSKPWMIGVPGAHWLPPMNILFSPVVKQGERGASGKLVQVSSPTK
jgi:hypothetical protein